MPLDRAGREFTFDFVRPPGRRVSFPSRLLEATEDIIVVAHDSSPATPVSHFREIVLDRGYETVWFLFKDQPFDVGRFYRPDGTWTGYYVDVLEPVHWQGSDPTTLAPIIDLFLDVWIAPDGRYLVLDEDEFEEAIRLGDLTTPQVDHARRVLRGLVAATERGAFPPLVVREFRRASTPP